jgi:hypothetical protein
MDNVVQLPIYPNKRVYVLHPDVVGEIVAQGIAGMSYKSVKNKPHQTGGRPLCETGTQMVTILRILWPNVKALYSEDTGVTKKGAAREVKWDCRFLREATKT